MIQGSIDNRKTKLLSDRDSRLQIIMTIILCLFIFPKFLKLLFFSFLFGDFPIDSRGFCILKLSIDTYINLMLRKIPFCNCLSIHKKVLETIRIVRTKARLQPLKPMFYYMAMAQKGICLHLFISSNGNERFSELMYFYEMQLLAQIQFRTLQKDWYSSRMDHD